MGRGNEVKSKRRRVRAPFPNEGRQSALLSVFTSRRGEGPALDEREAAALIVFSLVRGDHLFLITASRAAGFGVCPREEAAAGTSLLYERLDHPLVFHSRCATQRPRYWAVSSRQHRCVKTIGIFNFSLMTAVSASV